MPDEKPSHGEPLPAAQPSQELVAAIEAARARLKETEGTEEGEQPRNDTIRKKWQSTRGSERSEPR